MNRCITTVAALAAAVSIQSAASAQPHGSDILLSTDNGRIITGAVEDTQIVFPVRVFAGEFGEFIPNATDEPGFDAEPGALPPSTLIGLSVRKALRVWSGSAFTEIPDERLQITKGASTIETPPADPPAGEVAGSLALGITGSGGTFHQHAGYTLGSPADTGVYLLELQMWMTDPATGVSEPLWIIFNQNEPDDVLDEAIHWVEDHLANPCPADFDHSGTLTLSDFVAFRNAYTSGDLAADFDTSGALTLADFISFRNAYTAGCP